MAEKHPGGRPPHYDTPEKMQAVIDNFFEDSRENDEPLTITGLALALGFLDRRSIYDYEERGKFSYVVKRARLKIEHHAEKLLLSRPSNSAGPIFALKNYGWTDKQEIEHSASDELLNAFSDVSDSVLRKNTKLKKPTL